MRKQLVIIALLAAMPACVVGSDPDAEEDLDVEVVESVADLPPELVESIDTGAPLVLAASVNLLGNTSFESAIGSTPSEGYQNWFSQGYAGRATYTTYSGVWSLRAYGSVSDTIAVGSQLIRVDGNATYHVSTQARVTATGLRRQRMTVAFYDLFGRVVDTRSTAILRGEGRWHPVQMDVIAPGGAWFMSVTLGKGWTCTSGCSGDTVYYDSTSVRSI
jgi:hypothetical protein